MIDKFEELCIRRDSVVIFQSLGEDDVISRLMYLIGADTENQSEFIGAYSDFVEALYSKGEVNLSEYILQAVLENENLYIKLIANGKKPDKFIYECLLHELDFLQAVSRLVPSDFADLIDYDGYLPKWRTSEIDFIGSYMERMKMIGIYGYGKYARHKMFVLRKGKTVAVKYPDTQKLSELYGYKSEIKAVENNTLALLDGKPAQNVLLYGDAGTGKSSTVKALVNEYYDRGLRLIEVTKEQLRELPDIIDSIIKNPLKFIIFIDDLSFSSDDDCFGALKATLEGSVSAREDNIVIYATSNRRHLVKEKFSDRDGDDIHKNDTIQELISLSARFGLKVNFSKPDKNSYIEIAKSLAEQKGITLDEEKFSIQAEAFALKNGGRSARTAKQFVNQLIADAKN